ncbi:30S ribosomal protein S15 [Candidatus Karelsulcia muelleri]|uniref:30S ribosomal protein S15 n=1 Tax=Candidatus Karelsulcia muelleri TaxID=336810 RepID=UPI001FF1DEBD|nr:30S ribosomal protein S15 [Candidatus Karelsulcia muelleri]UOQ27771.1 30S ribosomal protein S15 [Candidatus Karelsulcia muelleri]UOQ38196.1 30S ribosomal protein S15 [Candidatus Karelsulcia muelleri]
MKKLDTGSNLAQLLYLNKKIKRITNHLKQNQHDYNSYRILIKQVTKKKQMIKSLLKKK